MTLFEQRRRFGRFGRTNSVSAMSEDYRLRVNNPVIIKDEVGKARQSCYALPPDGHAYGCASRRDPEGARAVTSKWVQHAQSVPPQDLAQDFRAINKVAATRGVRTGKQMNDFRKGVDMRLNGPRGPDGTVLRQLPRHEAVYGRANLPSTPMHDLLSGQYASEFESAIHAQYEAYAGLATDAPNGKRRIKTTKASNRGAAGAAPSRGRRPVPTPGAQNLRRNNLPDIQPNAAGQAAMIAESSHRSEPSWRPRALLSRMQATALGASGPGLGAAGRQPGKVQGQPEAAPSAAAGGLAAGSSVSAPSTCSRPAPCMGAHAQQRLGCLVGLHASGWQCST
ncbi:unnamed protein product [Effrenium voratum]|nr:unnamed protein product [Effrenium voratum]